MKPEQERVKTVLIDTVSLLCKNGLPYERELKIQAVIGISIDENDVFVVHIDESFSPTGASNISSSVAPEASMTLVPFQPQQQKRPPGAPSTPSSAAKKIRVESDVGLSPGAAQQHATQQLRFSTPEKSSAAFGGFPRTPSNSSAMPRSPGMVRGSATTTRGPLRGRKRGMGRGGMNSATAGPTRGMARGGPRGSGPMRGMPRGAGPRPSRPYGPHGDSVSVDRPGSTPAGFDLKPDPAHTYLATSAGINPSASFTFGSYHPADMPMFTSSGSNGSSIQQPTAGNSVPPGYGFDSVFPADSNDAQLGSFADINPTLEFGFSTSFPPSDEQFAASTGSVSSSHVKAESPDEDVIFVDEDRPTVSGPGSSSTSSSAAGAAGFDEAAAANDDPSNPSDVVQQITRRVTITTNIQGQNVKYEQVQHAVATMPNAVAPTNSNTMSFLPAADSSTLPTASMPYTDSSIDPSMAAAGQYQHPGGLYGGLGAGYTTAAAGADMKPGWESLHAAAGHRPSGGAAASGNMYSTGMPSAGREQHSARGTSGSQRGGAAARRMMSPRSNVTSAHMPPMSAGTTMSMDSPAAGGRGSGRGMRHPGPVSQRGGGVRAPGPKKSSTGAAAAAVAAAANSSAGGMALSDVGMGGGNVEDGTAWSMVARFVCSVPGCGASFSKKHNLLRHQSQKHGRQKAGRMDGSGMMYPDDDYGSGLGGADDDDAIGGFY